MSACKCCAWTFLFILIGIGIAGYIYRDEILNKYNEIKNGNSKDDDLEPLQPKSSEPEQKILNISETYEDNREIITVKSTTTSSIETSTTTTTTTSTTTQTPITTKIIEKTTIKSPEIDHSGNDATHDNYEKSKGKPEGTNDEDYIDEEEGSGLIV